MGSLGLVEKCSSRSATFVSNMKIPSWQVKENAFIGRKGKQFIVLQRVNRLNRVYGFTLTESLPGKRSVSSFLRRWTYSGFVHRKWSLGDGLKFCCHRCSVSFLFQYYVSRWATVQFSSVQSLSRVRLFATPWIAARQASLSITISRSLLRLTSIKSMMPSSHLILGRPLFRSWKVQNCSGTYNTVM